MTIASWFVIDAMIPANASVCSGDHRRRRHATGIITGFTRPRLPSARAIARQSETGAATNIIAGLGLGMSPRRC
jgi:Na+/H+-translocating membrane pyrophosphatase